VEGNKAHTIILIFWEGSKMVDVKKGSGTDYYIFDRLEKESKMYKVVKELRATGKPDTEILEGFLYEALKGIRGVTTEETKESVLGLVCMAYGYYHELYLIRKGIIK
jgi:hypothetical protein